MSYKDKDLEDWLQIEILKSENRDIYYNPNLDGGKSWPCYRLVILKSICNIAIKINDEVPFMGLTRESFENHLKTLVEYLHKINSENKFVDDTHDIKSDRLFLLYYQSSFLELFPFLFQCRRGDTKGKFAIGLTLVDRSAGTFPLILYPGYFEGEKKKGDRLMAFQLAAKDLLSHARPVHDIIRKNKFGRDWVAIKEQTNKLFQELDEVG